MICYPPTASRYSLSSVLSVQAAARRLTLPPLTVHRLLLPDIRLEPSGTRSPLRASSCSPRLVELQLTLSLNLGLSSSQRPQSMLTFETDQIQGGDAIVGKLAVSTTAGSLSKTVAPLNASPSPAPRVCRLRRFSTRSAPWTLSPLPTLRLP